MFISLISGFFLIALCSAQNNQTWRWIKGRSAANFAGIYGDRGTSAPSNTPGGRESPQIWSLDGYVYMFGGDGFGYNNPSPGPLSDLWQLEMESMTWKWIEGSSVFNNSGLYGIEGVEDSSNFPGARSGGGSWTQDGYVYIFGGSGRGKEEQGLLSDVWQLAMISMTLTWMKGSSTPNNFGEYGIRSVANTANSPGGRAVFVAWTHDGYAYVFGGAGFSSSSYGWLNELWRLEISSMAWTWVHGSSLEHQVGVYGTRNVQNPDNTPGAMYGSSEIIAQQ